MENIFGIAIIFSAALLAALFVQVRKNKMLDVYWGRACAGREWKRRYPEVSKDEIRSFLVLVVDSFYFNRKNKLKFKPEDKISEIYRATHPIAGLPDDLELETFIKKLKITYGIELGSNTDQNITLGEIFELTIKEFQSNAPCDRRGAHAAR